MNSHTQTIQHHGYKIHFELTEFIYKSKFNNAFYISIKQKWVNQNSVWSNLSQP